MYHYKEIEITRANHIDFADFGDGEVTRKQVNGVQLKCSFVSVSSRMPIATERQCESVEVQMLMTKKKELD